MCGIFACIGNAGDAVGTVVSGLRSLEYRGYDSAGIGVVTRHDPHVQRVRVQGGVDALVQALTVTPPSGPLAVGHTRWATHGAAVATNAHPHVDCAGQLGIVHNGIVENFAETRAALLTREHVLDSATDTELLIHLVEEHLRGDEPADVDGLVRAVRHALTSAEGSHACIVFAAGHPDVLICARRGSAGGLRIALEDDRAYVASDGAVLSAVAHTACVVPPDTLAVVTPAGVSMLGLFDDAAVAVQWTPLPQAQAMSRVPDQGAVGGLLATTAFFREALEQPSVLAGQVRTVHDALHDRMTPGASRNGHLLIDAVRARRVRTVRLLACGTPMYACLVGRDYVQAIAGMPAIVELAHEFAHSPYAMAFDADLTVVVSQSGETADSLLALEKAKAAGSLCVAVTNTVDSSLDRAADVSFYTRCGPEYSVAQTKAFTGAIVALLAIACLLARHHGTLTPALRDTIGHDAEQLSTFATQTLQLARAHLTPIVSTLTQRPSCLFVARGLCCAAALEGALKLKELSYLHAEGYAAGELKHGPIALIEPGFPVIAIVCRDQLRPKMLSQLAEVAARGAEVIVVAEEHDQQARAAASLTIPVPDGCTSGLLAPVITVIPLQLLAGLVAGALGRDIDRPRNLAKSVTVI